MTKDEVIENLGLEEGTVFLEPCEVFNKGIIGTTENHQQLIYGYWNLVNALVDDYEEEWKNNGCKGDKPDFYSDATEWLDYNTIRSIPYIANDHKGLNQLFVLKLQNKKFYLTII